MVVLCITLLQLIFVADTQIILFIEFVRTLILLNKRLALSIL